MEITPQTLSMVIRIITSSYYHEYAVAVMILDNMKDNYSLAMDPNSQRFDVGPRDDAKG